MESILFNNEKYKDSMKKFTLQELENMETLSQGHTDNLKLHEENIKVWLSRMTIEDGMKYNNEVTIEQYIDGKWIIIDQYEAL